MFKFDRKSMTFKLDLNAPIVQTGNVPSFDGFKPEESEEDYLARKLFPEGKHTYTGDPGQPQRMYTPYSKLEAEVMRPAHKCIPDENTGLLPFECLKGH